MATFVELLLTALQFQAEGLLTVGEILFSSREKTRRRFYRIPTEEQHWFKENWADTYRDRRQFHRTLQYLKRQGRIAKKTKAQGSWMLTQRGKEKVTEYKNVREDPLSSANASFIKPHGNGITIVAYDILERERRKRAWIRLCLVEMGCKMIQKSVWMAKGMIDENFIHALRERDLLGHVHIFSVTEQGTMHIGMS